MTSDNLQLRTPTANLNNHNNANVSRRPVLSVRRRIINTPTIPATLTAATSTTTTTTVTEIPTTITATTTINGSELQLTSKYNRLRSRPPLTTTQQTSAPATFITTPTATQVTNTQTTIPAKQTTTTTTSAVTAQTIYNNNNNKNYNTNINNYNNNNNYNKLKAKNKLTTTAEPSTPTSSPSSSTSYSATFDNTITQQKQQQQNVGNKASPASLALRRKFQPRRLITTQASSAISNTDESATEPPRTQNPLFKRRFSLTYTISATTTSTTPRSNHRNDIAAVTASYADAGDPEDATDQVAKSSIHTSRFKQANNAAAEEEEALVMRAVKVLPKVSVKKTKVKSSSSSSSSDVDIGEGETITRRMDHSNFEYDGEATSTAASTSSSSAARRGSAAATQATAIKRRPQKTTTTSSTTTPRAARHRQRYVRVEPSDRLNHGPTKETKRSQSQRGYQTNFDYDYYDDGSVDSSQPSNNKKGQQLKVILHGRGIIECLDQGNFPHPLSCRKFISCAKFETGGVVGWEYTCPKGLRYDPTTGMCNWSVDAPCRD